MHNASHIVNPASLYDLGDLRAGNLELFIASRREDIEAAQELRYRIFFEEIGGRPTEEVARTKRDVDEFDPACDHLLVVEHQPEGNYKVVGTYRMLRREAMKRIGRFYSEAEFDISAFRGYPGEIMEVGRSCVDSAFRNRAVMQLLWRGIGAYVARFNISILFGCASFHGTDLKEHATALSYLYHYHLAPPELRPTALKNRYVEMNQLPKEAIDAKAAFIALPPLIKGYLRLNGRIGAGAVIDTDYNTTDVSIIVKTDMVTDKYFQRYGKL
jgi:L-ornithine Nalpha-acyltransferase